MKKNQDIVTFKVDKALLDLMKGIENRSEFIRVALLAALNNVCPVCRGTGVLTPNSKEHWEKFSQDHRVKECGGCHEMTVVCRK